jgi:hypothetical protein
LDATYIHAYLSLIWAGALPTGLRRNATPHQTLTMQELTRLIELFIFTSRMLKVSATTERQNSSPNEISILASICAFTPKTINQRVNAV